MDTIRSTKVRRVRWGVAAAVVVLLGVGLTRVVGDEPGGSAQMAALRDGSNDEGGTLSAKTAAGTGGGTTAADAVATGAVFVRAEERVVRTATIEVEVGDGQFGRTFSEATTIASANGGFVASSSSFQGADGDRQSAGSLVVRVPADRFDATRQQLGGLGKVRSQEVQGEDVGGQLTDLDARLRNFRSQEEALRLLMAKTGTIGETIEVQRQLSSVREQVEQLAGEQARLTDAVTFATLQVSLAEPGVALGPDDGRSPLPDALHDAVIGAERVVAASVVIVGYLLPLALLLTFAWLVTRLLAARRRPAAVVPAP